MMNKLIIYIKLKFNTNKNNFYYLLNHKIFFYNLTMFFKRKKNFKIN